MNTSAVCAAAPASKCSIAKKVSKKPLNCFAAVAPSAQALIVKVLDDTGRGYESDVAAGIRYAADQGARVINLSLGPEVPVLNNLTGSPVPGAITYAVQKGAMVAAAAGNTAFAPSDYNAVAGEALIVGALASLVFLNLH